MSSKCEEGEEHLEKAKKYSRSQLLTFKPPDYFSAADEYSKAAVCFRRGRNYNKSRDCYMKCAECHKQNRSLFHAARALDQAILIQKELNDFKPIRKLAERACYMYQQDGSTDSAAQCLARAAKIVEPSLPEDALLLYQHALDVTEDDAQEYISKVAKVQIKLKMFDQAADSLRREIGYNSNSGIIGRLTVVLVIVELAREDVEAARKAFNQYGNYCGNEEVRTLVSLLQAYDDKDPALAKRALSQPFIQYMDIEYSRLADNLKLPMMVTDKGGLC